ncbi:LysR substrate-binding domain-containing protein [Sulfitobacter sp.]|uniref:LysR substrate-binding domain-containing protein n=1 Tax=Sulfitobacter sp. TaxID=1903071 RepID=UPI0030011E82
MALHRDGTSVSFQPENVRLEVDTNTSCKSAVVARFGVQQLPLSEIEEGLASGQLVRVLPEVGIFAVWPDIGPQKSLTRKLTNFFLSNQAAQKI